MSAPTRSPGGRAASAPLMGRETEPTIFEISAPGRRAYSLRTTEVPKRSVEELIPAPHRRADPVVLPEVAERDLVAHFTRLSHRQYSVDLGAYPLGSCTMKYNPKICDEVTSMPRFRSVHPATPPSASQGWLQILVELEEGLCEVTGMAAATLQPAAGAAGELTGLLLMRAYHARRNEERSRVIIPDSAHGTNPASVRLGGYEVSTVSTDSRGLVDREKLRGVLGPDVAGMMLTNPNTLGLFEEEIVEIAKMVHDAGGLLYYDGANLNPILGVVRPGDMGFDIVHLNLHKTFATPHGGGGPGAGPVAVAPHLVELLPGPRPVRTSEGFSYNTPEHSIGRVHSWQGNAARLVARLDLRQVERRRGIEARRGDLGSERQLAPRAPARCLRLPLRPPGDARVRRLVVDPQARDRGAHTGRREAALGVRVPRPDGVLPARRRRGADDRTDRNREP